jgi:hypothetical protein
MVKNMGPVSTLNKSPQPMPSNIAAVKALDFDYLIIHFHQRQPFFNTGLFGSRKCNIMQINYLQFLKLLDTFGQIFQGGIIAKVEYFQILKL